MDGPAEWAETQLGASFRNRAILLTALTHKSFGRDNYERLEFLGDRILGAVLAVWLFELFPDESEGKLTRRMARLASRETCARIARRLGVPGQVRLGPQARSDGGADSDNILGDVMEALIGAAHLDGGPRMANALIRLAWRDEVAAISEAPKHPKSELQEWAASRALQPPVYRLLGRTGPHHNPRFQVELTIAPLPPILAEGASKQEAETLAAKAFLDAHAN